MAIYHLHVQTISRSGAKTWYSAVAAAAYRSGEKLTLTTSDEQSRTYDYTHKRGIVASEILAPHDAPDWATDRQSLWSEVEAVEKRKDARLAREVEVALPNEIARDIQLNLVRGFTNAEFVSRGMVADISIHDKGDGNPHAHILLTDRPLEGEDFSDTKNRSWNDRNLVTSWREAWEEHLNAALEYCGIAEQVSSKSLAEQGIDRLPQIHIGVGKDVHDNGHDARRQRNEDIKAYNKTLAEIKAIDAEEQKIRKQLEDLLHEIEAEKAAHQAEEERKRADAARKTEAEQQPKPTKIPQKAEMEAERPLKVMVKVEATQPRQLDLPAPIGATAEEPIRAPSRPKEVYYPSEPLQKGATGVQDRQTWQPEVSQRVAYRISGSPTKIIGLIEELKADSVTLLVGSTKIPLSLNKGTMEPAPNQAPPSHNRQPSPRVRGRDQDLSR